MRILLAMALGGLVAGCATTVTQRPPGDVAAEARQFMDGYARDLLAGDREAIAGRYDRRGAYLLGNGRKDYERWDSIAAHYRTGWRPPARFEWLDLSYEPAGPDAVAVMGRFVWHPATGQPVTLSYSGLLVRREGGLRIRMEDESIDPGSLPSRCPPDSAG